MSPSPPQRQHRSSHNQQPPANPPNLPKDLAHRGGASGHGPRLLVRRNSRDGEPGEWVDVDRERRSRNRSNSTPPDNRHHHHRAAADHRHRPTQNGQTGFAPVSANESWAWGQQWVNTWWKPNSTEVQVQAQFQVGGQLVVRGSRELREGRGHGEDDDNRGRSRRSSDAKHAPPTPAPAPRRMPTPSPSDSSPVIPGITATDGMGFRNLLRKRHSRHRPKILFYHKHQPHYGFTNFSPHAVMYGGKRYPTSEHLFQSFKVSVPERSYGVPFFLADLWMFTVLVYS